MVFYYFQFFILVIYWWGVIFLGVIILFESFIVLVIYCSVIYSSSHLFILGLFILIIYSNHLVTAHLVLSHTVLSSPSYSLTSAFFRLFPHYPTHRLQTQKFTPFITLSFLSHIVLPLFSYLPCLIPYHTLDHFVLAYSGILLWSSTSISFYSYFMITLMISSIICSYRWDGYLTICIIHAHLFHLIFHLYIHLCIHLLYGSLSILISLFKYSFSHLFLDSIFR